MQAGPCWSGETESTGKPVCCTSACTRWHEHMAFWTAASKSNQAPSLRPAAGPAKPLTVLLHCPSDFNTLVRLKIRLPNNQLAAADEDDDEAVVTASATALARLHRLIIGIEVRSADAAKLSVTEVLQPPDTLQLLCQKVSRHTKLSLQCGLM